MLTLKEFRKKYHLTQAALAKEIGTTPHTISMYENNRWVMNEFVAEYIKEKYGEKIKPGKTPTVWVYKKVGGADSD